MLKRKSVLDVFTQITAEHEASKPDLCLRLWNHLNQLTEDSTVINEPEEEEEEEKQKISNEVTYTLRRLVQGLGSPRAYIRKCYFATLVSIISHCENTFGPITLTYFKSIVDKQLSKFDSKGEEGEVLTGRILAYGVAFKSKVFCNSTIELQQEVLSELLNKCKERSYLPLLAYTFVVDLIDTVDEDTFKTAIWPIIINEVMIEWPSQTFDTLNCLLQVEKKYPKLLKKKTILATLNTHAILHEDTIENVAKMLTNITWEPRLKHPLYQTVGNLLAQEDQQDLLLKFWTNVESILNSSSTRIQQQAVFNILSCIIEHLKCLEQIPPLLTSSLVDHLINACKSTINKSDKLLISARKTLQLIIKRATEKSEESNSSPVYKILCKLLIDSGQLLIDKITGLRVVSPCVAKLGEKHVKLLAKKMESIILMKNIRWKFKDRCYATQLLARLISHPKSQDMDWKIKHLKVMLKYGIFIPTTESDVQISSELAVVLKNSFFTALSHQLSHHQIPHKENHGINHQSSHLENHRMVLISLVYYIDNIMTVGDCQLRTSVSQEVLNCWKETMAKIQKIDLKINTSEKRKTIMYVFQTLFLQMALHLFVDADVARDILNELDRCYKKEKIQKKNLKQKNSSLDENSEPEWIEIAVELLLTLLFRDTFLLRQLISRIFPYLCPYLTAQSSSQILQILDPASSSDILTDENGESADDDDNDDDEDNEDEDEEEEEKKVKKLKTDVDLEEESDSEVEEDENIEESAIEKTRQAVRDALGIAGSVTDTESIDLDDIDEEEGRRLDKALSEAFKKVQRSQNKNKKQSPNDKALTNFRIRVMDLVDIYLDNEPSLALVLDTIPPLFALLEFCIKDSHQKPLETRIRSTLKKIGNLKKCTDLKQVNEELLADILKNLMDKGVRSTSVFLDLSTEMSECCTFLLRMGIQREADKKEKNKHGVLFNLFCTAIENFFLKRDCLLPLGLFENILLKIHWNKNIQLCERILSCIFNPSVRGFRRNQGLSLLCCFYKNTRLLSMVKESNSKDYAKLEDSILTSTIDALSSLKNENSQKLKPSFVLELFLLLYTIKSGKFCMQSTKWKDLGKLLQSFVNNGSLGLNLAGKYIVKLCLLLNVSITKPTNRKRKRNDDETVDQVKVKKNGLISNHSLSDDESEEHNEVTLNGNIFKDKTVIKKKKSKRKTKEYFASKQLRNDTLLNNVDVFNFSTINVTET